MALTKGQPMVWLSKFVLDKRATHFPPTYNFQFVENIAYITAGWINNELVGNRDFNDF